MNDFPYIRGRPAGTNLPLQRHQPDFPVGVVSAWLKKHPIPPGLLLFPLGNVPHLPLEAARAGYQCLVTANNPISRFLIKHRTSPFSLSALQSSLSALASTHKGQERLQPHILSLYHTRCPGCGKTISAQAFLWKENALGPHAKLCACPHCGESGEYPTSPEDIQKAQSFQNNSLYHARALTRIAPPQDPIHAYAKEALQAYTPRSVYALFTLINKSSALSLSQTGKDCLSALLLSACYQALNLWEYPAQDDPFTTLTIPPVYRERNLWFTLEETLPVWTGTEEHIPLTQWPELPPPEGGITLFKGPLRDLSPHPLQSIQAVVAGIPQPNLAYWNLSALWSGWIWGQKAAAPLRPVFRLHSFDWGWHTHALSGLFNGLQSLLEASAPCLGVFCEGSEDLLLSTLQASYRAGFRLQTIALDTYTGQGQLLWHKGQVPPGEPDARQAKAILRSDGYTQIRNAGEPLPALKLKSSGWAALDEQNALPIAAERSQEDHFQALKTLTSETYAFREGFLYYEDLDRWWHKEAPLQSITYSDRVEMALVKLLVDADVPLPRTELEDALFERFPALLTPDSQLLQVCLKAYGVQDPPQSECWRLRPGETPTARKADLADMRALLRELGKKLGFIPREGPPLDHVLTLTWENSAGVQYTFFITASALVSKIILDQSPPPPTPWIALPGSRANLVIHKLKHHPPLSRLIDRGWNFIKFRHIRRLSSDVNLSAESLPEHLSLDPLTYTEPQLPLL